MIVLRVFALLFKVYFFLIKQNDDDAIGECKNNLKLIIIFINYTVRDEKKLQ